MATSDPAVVRIALTPDTRQLLVRLIHAIESLNTTTITVQDEANTTTITVQDEAYAFAEGSGVERDGPLFCVRCHCPLTVGEYGLCADCEQGSE